jgi:hypothetical protein
MKHRTKELDVDFIGGQNNPLTSDEQLAISKFIQELKAKRGKRVKMGKKLSTRKTASVSVIKKQSSAPSTK